MKNLFLAAIVIICSQHSFSQTKDVAVNNNETTSKFFVSASGGLLTVNKGKDYGYNFDLGVGYQLSNRINLLIEGMHGQAKNKETSFLYDVNKYSVLAEISNKQKDSFLSPHW